MLQIEHEKAAKRLIRQGKPPAEIAARTQLDIGWIRLEVERWRAHQRRI